MTDNRAGTLELVAVNVARAFNPVRAQLDGALSIELFADMGVLFPPELAENAAYQASLESARDALDFLPDAIDALLIAIDQGDFVAALEKFADLDGALGGAGSALEQVSNALNAAAVAGATPGFTVAEVNAFTNGLPKRLFDWSVISTFENNLPVLGALLDLLGVFERTEEQVGSADPKFPQYTRRVLRLDRLPRAVSSPFGALEDLYGFGTPGFDGLALFAKIASIFSQAGLPALFEASPTPKVDLVFAELTRNTTVSPPGLDLLLKTGFNQEFSLERPPLLVTATTRLLAPVGSTLTIEANRALRLAAPGSGSTEGELRVAMHVDNSAEPIVLLGRAEGNRLDVSGQTLDAGLSLVWDGSAARGTFDVSAEVQGLHLVLGAPDGDGLLAELLPGGGVDAVFELGIRLGGSGFEFTGSGGLRVILPLHLDLGVASVESVSIGLELDAGQIVVPVGATVRGIFGPFQMLVEGVGIEATFGFPEGSLRGVETSIGFKSPTGIGVSIDGGGISGGGFLSHDPVTGRYAGALELRVFLVAVKAFGVLDTRFPDGTAGMSFVVLISAEFTPIQLGFGFTLVGVGGLLGVNRAVAAEALGDAVRTGALGHLLFPRNPVQDAPAIINDLATVFPATRGRQLFGPMAKFGWGTPTLITADIGIVIEFPGPRLALLGVVHMVLPSAKLPLLQLNCAIAGLLDFPAGKMAIDASLFDSRVAGYVVSGDMAYRLETGNSTSFLMSVGGFNPGFDAPARFPDLRRASVDLGVSGNPRLTASGYFALTSNTAQFGGRVDLNFRAGGFRVDGHFGFDTLFVFSPFRFTASISAGIHVSYEGVGFGVTLHGDLKGPTPWEFHGRVCVDLLLDEVCLGMSFTFGRSEPAALPEMDPWFGNTDVNADPRVQVIGLQAAITDARNWQGEEPENGYRVVSLSRAATADRTPIDPVGPATLRQKVCPLDQQLEKFGEYRPVGHTRFDISSVALAGIGVSDFERVEDAFAPGHFTELSKAQKLSSRSYDDLVAGVKIAPNRAAAGPVGSHTVAFETVFITEDGQRIEESPTDPRYTPTDLELRGMLKRSAAALSGVRRAGAQKYMLHGKPKLLTFAKPKFVVASSCDLTWNTSITQEQTSYTKALLLLREHERNHPEDRNRFKVVPFHAAA